MPELPRSSGAAGWSRPPTPTPSTVQASPLGLDPRAHRPQRGGGRRDVAAVVEPLDPAAADRERGEDQRPVRDALVAGNGRAAQFR